MAFEEEKKELHETLSIINKQYERLAEIPEYIGDDFTENVGRQPAACKRISDDC